MRNRGNIFNNRWADLRVFVLSPGETILGAQRHFSRQFLVNLAHVSGEAILGTQRYFSKQFLSSFLVSRLRQGDFRYTTICFQSILV